MTPVQIVPNKTTGQVLSAYQSNPEYGYVQLQQTAMVIDGGWVREVKRSTLLRAKMDLLTKFVQGNKTLTLPGNLVVKEYLESEVPAEMAERFYAKNAADYEEQVGPYVKRSGEDGIELTHQGERIIRFTVYDQTGTDADVRVAHDNIDAVRQHASAVANSAKAML